VLGLGEATLLHACSMGRKLGLIAINPAFIPTHNEQVCRYGLQQRIAGIRAMEANISDYMEAFTSPRKSWNCRPSSNARHVASSMAALMSSCRLGAFR